jgi:hypothetical protein
VRLGWDGPAPRKLEAITRPEIVLRPSGALGTVASGLGINSYTPGPSTGVFFAERPAESRAEAVRFSESSESRFSPAFIRCHAERYGVSHFKLAMGAFIDFKMQEFRGKRPVAAS